MTWSITDWSVAQKIANVPLLSEFVDAINERLVAVGAAPLPAVVSGDSVQVYTLIRSWQDACVYLPGFVVSHSAGAPLGAGYYNGKAGIPAYVDSSTLFAAAGLATAYWRAYTTRPSKGGADQARLLQANDIIGTWLFEDLQKLLKAAIWTFAPSLSYTSETKSGVGSADNWGDAKAAAETAFAAADVEGGTTGPQALASGIKQLGPWYGATLIRSRAKITVSGIPTALAHAVEFYLKAVAGSNGFDANGDDVLDGLFSLMETVGPTTDASVESGWIGTLAQPNWCDPPEGELGWSKGYSTDVVTPVVKWDTAGGFVYV